MKATGQFMEAIAATSKTELFNGDVLVTKTKGHTVVVVSGNPRHGNTYYPKYEGTSGSIITALAAVGEKTHRRRTGPRLQPQMALQTTHIPQRRTPRWLIFSKRKVNQSISSEKVSHRGG